MGFSNGLIRGVPKKIGTCRVTRDTREWTLKESSCGTGPCPTLKELKLRHVVRANIRNPDETPKADVSAPNGGSCGLAPAWISSTCAVVTSFLV
jgi:hypothetical protein